MSPVEAKPHLRRAFPPGFGGHHGQGATPCQDQLCTSQPPATPRLRKPGIKDFTDPRNPFYRCPSKQITRVEDVRSERGRAGAPTKNPGMLPFEQTSHERQRDEDGRFRLVPHRYGNQEWRVAKKPVPETSSPAVAAERGAASWMRPSSGVLENYLNDMKRSKHARGTVASPPSFELLRMHEARTRLPADRQMTRARALSCEPVMEDRKVASFAYPWTRSVSQSPFPRGEADLAEKHSFTRKKREVKGAWTQGKSDLLHHSDSPGTAEMGSPRTPSSTRARQASERFEEMTEHMKAFTLLQRQEFRLVKSKDKNTDGILSNEQAVLHPPSERRPKLGVVTPRSWLSTASSFQSLETGVLPEQTATISSSTASSTPTLLPLAAEN